MANSIEKSVKTAIDRLARNDTTLTSLKLNSKNIGDDDAKAIATALTHNTSLQQLNLSYNQIRDDGAKAIATALQLNTRSALQQLVLSENQISADGARAIATALQHNTSLQQLYLSYNQIRDDSAKAIATALTHNTSLQQLYLICNQIGADGAKAIATALQHNTSLQKLDLTGNRISDDGAKAIATALQYNTHSALQQLDLSGNLISADGAKAIASTSLQQLDLHNNQISDDGAKAIAIALQHNTTLQQLTLSVNRISDAGAKAIATALQDNTRSVLQKLDLYGNQISADGAKAIATAAAHIKSLQVNLHGQKNNIDQLDMEDQLWLFPDNQFEPSNIETIRAITAESRAENITTDEKSSTNPELTDIELFLLDYQDDLFTTVQELIKVDFWPAHPDGYTVLSKKNTFNAKENYIDLISTASIVVALFCTSDDAKSVESQCNAFTKNTSGSLPDYWQKHLDHLCFVTCLTTPFEVRSGKVRVDTFRTSCGYALIDPITNKHYMSTTLHGNISTKYGNDITRSKYAYTVSCDRLAGPLLFDYCTTSADIALINTDGPMARCNFVHDATVVHSRNQRGSLISQSLPFDQASEARRYWRRRRNEIIFIHFDGIHPRCPAVIDSYSSVRFGNVLHEDHLLVTVPFYGLNGHSGSLVTDSQGNVIGMYKGGNSHPRIVHANWVLDATAIIVLFSRNMNSVTTSPLVSHYPFLSRLEICSCNAGTPSRVRCVEDIRPWYERLFS